MLPKPLERPRYTQPSQQLLTHSAELGGLCDGKRRVKPTPGPDRSDVTGRDVIIRGE